MNSKYYLNWEEYKENHPELAGKPEAIITAKLQKYDDIMFHFVIGLLL